MIIYLAGPMSGYEDHNFPAFDEATAVLRAEGHCVISPAEISRGMGVTSENTLDKERYAICMRKDIHAILQCDALVMLPGWHRSKGARAEAHIADLLNLPVIAYESRLPVHGFVETRIA